MSQVKVGKGQVTIPTRIRSRLGIGDGDILDMSVRSNCVVLTRKSPQFPDDEVEYSSKQRRIIDAELGKGLEDVKMGRVYGPFKTAAELVASIKSELRKRARKKAALRSES